MHSVILHFRGHPKNELDKIFEDFGVKNESFQDGENYFFLWSYTEEEFNSEYDEQEKKLVLKKLNGKPEVSYQLACRTIFSRKALEIVIYVFSRVKDSLMDDDSDGFWRLDQLKNKMKNSKTNLYNLNDIEVV